MDVGGLFTYRAEAERDFLCIHVRAAASRGRRHFPLASRCLRQTKGVSLRMMMHAQPQLFREVLQELLWDEEANARVAIQIYVPQGAADATRRASSEDGKKSAREDLPSATAGGPSSDEEFVFEGSGLLMTLVRQAPL